MIAHLGAVRDSLAGLLYSTHLVDAPTVTAQYVVLSGPGWGKPDEMPVCGASQSMETDFRVTAVTGTAEGVGIMLQRHRDLLSPSLGEVRIPMQGRLVTVRFVRPEVIAVDRDNTVVNTNRHPCYGVETYHLTSEPL